MEEEIALDEHTTDKPLTCHRMLWEKIENEYHHKKSLSWFDSQPEPFAVFSEKFRSHSRK